MEFRLNADENTVAWDVRLKCATAQSTERDHGVRTELWNFSFVCCLIPQKFDSTQSCLHHKITS